MLKSIVGFSPWRGEWKYCTECGNWTKFGEYLTLDAHGLVCPKCEKKKTEDKKGKI